MTKLHQIQLRHDAHEDRALLRITTDDRSEFRFWITRRYARLMWAGLTGTAARDPVHTPIAPQAVLAFEQEAAVAKADFNTRFDDSDTSTPLGDAPLLLARLKCVRESDGITLLAMHPLHGQGIELRLDKTLLHSVLKLLADAARAAEWDLDTSIAQPPPAGPLN